MAIGMLARLSPGVGAPREILDRVTFADWSPDGSSLAVVHLVGSRGRLEYPIGRVLYESPGWISHIRMSPGGDKIAFLEHPIFPDDRGSVMVVGTHGPARALSGAFTSVDGLAWSPTGEEIWFSAATSGLSRSIYAVDLHGRSRAVLSLPGSARVQDISSAGDVLLTSDNLTAGIRGRAPGESAERDLTWLDWSIAAAISRDGRTLLFDEEGEGGGPNYAVCIRGMDGSQPIRLGEGSAEDLSPDGKWVVANRYWTNPPDLLLLPTGPGQARALPPTGLENIVTAQFFPSGERLLILGNERGRGLRLYVRGLEGGPLRPIAPEGFVARAGAISPDGKWVVGLVPGGDPSLFPVEGGSPRPIQGRLPEEIVLGWSANGKSIYVERPGGRPVDVIRVDLATGKRVSWERIQGGEDRAGVSLGVLHTGPDDHSYVYVYSRNLSELFLARGLR
jgi:Tol biopolymer transport system component